MIKQIYNAAQAGGIDKANNQQWDQVINQLVLNTALFWHKCNIMDLLFYSI